MRMRADEINRAIDAQVGKRLGAVCGLTAFSVCFAMSLLLEMYRDRAPLEVIRPQVLLVKAALKQIEESCGVRTEPVLDRMFGSVFHFQEGRFEDAEQFLRQSRKMLGDRLEAKAREEELLRP